MLEQRAAQRALQGMDGAVHADIAGVQLRRRARQVAAAHEGEKGLQLLKGQFFVDLHGQDESVGWVGRRSASGAIPIGGIDGYRGAQPILQGCPVPSDGTFSE
ncbi:hypothetical protein D3C76_1212370 [compost metagenome]